MKNQPNQKNSRNEQGKTTSDRVFHNLKQDKKERGISNGGGHRSDQTSSIDNKRKGENG